MNRSILPPVRDRLIQLIETLHHLKDRIREAVATEMHHPRVSQDRKRRGA